MRLTFLCALAAARCAACPGDGNHTTLEDGLIPSKIFSSGAIHTIKHSFPLGSRRTGEIAVESMMSVVLAKDLLPAPVNLADVCHKDMSKAQSRGAGFEPTNISMETIHVAAAAATSIFRGDESRRRRGRDADSPWRRVAAALWPRRG